MGGGRMIHVFKDCLDYSMGQRGENDLATIKALLAGCESCIKSTPELDRLGIDYIATLRRGAPVYVDAKTRKPGCARYWTNGPELAIEKWSVMPGGRYKTPQNLAKTGWTLDEAKLTDLILYVWHPQDSELAFLLPFQHLRMTARRYLAEWMRNYKVAQQDSGSWESEAVFVPAESVLDALRETMAGRIPVAEVAL